MFFKNQRKNDRKKPAYSTLVSPNIGVAVWLDDDGSIDVKLGHGFLVRARGTNEQKLIVKTTLPLENLKELPEAIECVARMFEHVSELPVPESLRRELGELASRLEAAVVPSVATELNNGIGDHVLRSRGQ